MKWGPVISVLLIIILIFSVLLFLEIKDIPRPASSSTTEDSDSGALVTYVGQGWAENELNSSEIIFDIDIYNFGYSEAKNVEVSCEIYSADAEENLLSETPILSASRNVGNVASTSYKEAQVYATMSNQVDDYSLSYCEVISCDECEILDERLK